MNIVLEGKRINSIESFHFEVKSSLNLPEYYGENLDALWDCLTGCIETPLTLIWSDFEISKANLPEFTEKALEVFKEAEKEVKGFYIKCS